MQDRDGELVLSPTDLVAFLACPHLSELSLEVVVGHRPRPAADDPEVGVVQRRGLAHERAYLAHLAALGRQIVEVPDGPLEDQVAATGAALEAGPDVVYQAAFFTAGWQGHADFLTRVVAGSALGDYAYEPEDTKLARHVRPSAVLQLCQYAEQLAAVQGTVPERIHVVLGGRARVSLRLADFAAYHRATRRRFASALAGGITAYPDPVVHCAVCAWREQCDQQRLADDHLSVVAGLTRDQAATLARSGITTVAQFAETADGPVPGIGSTTLARLRSQARLQVLARRAPAQPPPYELLGPAEPGRGLGALPAPSPGDLFFDIEGDPFVGDGLDYLLGVGWTEADGTFAHRALWAHDLASERRSFEQFVDLVTARRERHPDLHIYHYAPYEPTALGRLMGRHATREQEVDDLFRQRVLVDLLAVVRQGVRVGTPSYSLKRLEGLYMPARTQAITDAGSSIVEYERWIEDADPAILVALEEYNRVDCDSTRGLRHWLEDRRHDYTAIFGHAPPRPEIRVPGPDPAAPDGPGDLRAALGARAAADVGAAETYGLVVELLDWHRREDRPGWWRFFDRVLQRDGEELFADTEAVADLVPDGPAVVDRKSVVRTYRFDPDQEHRLRVGTQVVDPEIERVNMTGGTYEASRRQLVALDSSGGSLSIRMSPAGRPPRHLIPGGPIPNDAMRRALGRLAASVVDDGLDGPGPYRAVRDLLLCLPPRLAPSRAAGPLIGPGEEAATGAVDLARALDGGVLAIQGPPGSGKTRAAAAMIVGLVRGGRRVGVTAHSHAVIGNVLERALALAADEGVAFRISQRGEPGQTVDHPWVTPRPTPARAEADLDDGDVAVFAGTPWLFSREAFDQRLDHLIVDEAGQLSLANVAAVGLAARNLLLVGDPQQLAQPSEGTHPPGVGVSGLEHLLDGADTVPPALGVLLDRSYRLHPDICTYISEQFYDGRLRPDPHCARQRVGGAGPLSGAGLRWVPVEHRDNRSSADEEVEVVSAALRSLLGRPFTDRHSRERTIGLDDVLVVAPYNAQVSRLTAALPEGARVGTVDRFQGQEAPVVLISMASSSAEDAPRGLAFLYSRHRLNVAVSRAQALAVMVASPALLAATCRSVEQMRLANALCRYVELATEVSPDALG